mmetsp:Transcript_88333/g.191215  ORF Transcript_88333/g.191215 Transcript_88333/m.191215 type:complete len:230 (-) Transcript_88333:153-842(-)
MPQEICRSRRGPRRARHGAPCGAGAPAVASRAAAVQAEPPALARLRRQGLRPQRREVRRGRELGCPREGREAGEVRRQHPRADPRALPGGGRPDHQGAAHRGRPHREAPRLGQGHLRGGHGLRRHRRQGREVAPHRGVQRPRVQQRGRRHPGHDLHAELHLLHVQAPGEAATGREGLPHDGGGRRRRPGDVRPAPPRDAGRGAGRRRRRQNRPDADGPREAFRLPRPRP